MKARYFILCVGAALLVLSSCGGKKGRKSYDELSSSGMTTRTENLRTNVKAFADKFCMVGQMYGTLEGVGWQCDSGRCDMHNICNDRPAVNGYDISGMETGSKVNDDGLSFESIRRDVLENFRRGSLLVLYWKGLAVRKGGTESSEGRKSIQALGRFLDTLQNGYGIKAPVVLCLYPWEGKAWYRHLSVEEYRDLYRSTQKELEDAGVTNAIYGYSESYESATAFMDHCPADGIDVVEGCYIQPHTNASGETYAQAMKEMVGRVTAVAQERNAAVGLRTGMESVPYAQMFSKVLLPVVNENRIAYLMLGPNYGEGEDGHYSLPYPGCRNEAIEDFMQFYNDGRTTFMSRLNGLYLQHEG